MDGGELGPALARAASAQIRFMTAGDVDDGKSTLIGRLLLDAGALMRDQAAGIGDGDADLADITDGLEAERAQGITIDVAYRYFATPEARFVIADAPGHEQYTRNMVTAASVSDLAVVVVDVTRVERGQLRRQTRRHAAIATLMGLDVIVAVNKMDAVDWAQGRFEEVRAAFADLAGELGLHNVACVPISARRGDYVVRRGEADWWAGPTLLELIRRTSARGAKVRASLRLPVQVVLRAEGRRLYAGRLESGTLHAGDKVSIGAAKAEAIVARVAIAGRDVKHAEAGASVAIELDGDRDVVRGDVITDADARYGRSLVADLCWLDEHAWVKGRRYVLRQGTLETQALIDEVSYGYDISDLSARAAPGKVSLNEIVRAKLSTRESILADLYESLPGTGAFVLFDTQTNQTCAAGMIREAAS
ncbi:MAG: sulfate adenylyltransferase subunit 1 [Caulobacteraceae bacterium]